MSVRRMKTRNTRNRMGFLTSVGAGLFCSILVSSAASAQPIELLSRTARGSSAEGRSNAPALSANGSVAAFGSDALDLVLPPRDLHRSDVFLRRLGDSPTTTRVVRGLDGELDGASQAGGFAPSISADGSVVVYSSAATNLVDDDTNEVDDIFIFDANDGTTTRIVGPNGEGNRASTFPRISGDGNRVVFASQASNLVDQDTNQLTDIFLYQRDDGSIRRVSVASDGSQSTGSSRTPAISDDGRIVAFVSDANNFVTENLRGVIQVYVHDVESGQTEIVSISSDGTAANGTCFLPDTSADGSIIAFKSEAFNLVDGDTNGVPDVFVHNRGDASTERLSVDNFGNESNDLSGGPAISDDGRYVAFISFSSTFDPLDGNRFSDVFIVDRQPRPNQILRVTQELPSTGRPGGDVPDFPVAISGDGRIVGFASAAENLVVGDINNQIDAFVACNPFEAERCDEVPTPTPTATATPVPTDTPGPAACTGDCNGDGRTTIGELIRMTNMLLGVSICGAGTLQACPAGDANADCRITIDELIRAVGNTLNGCTRFGDVPLEVVEGMCCAL